MPLIAIPAFLSEKNKMEMYKENSFWIMAQSHLSEDKRDILVQPYIRKAEKEEKKSLSLEETLDYIFESEV